MHVGNEVTMLCAIPARALAAALDPSAGAVFSASNVDDCGRTI